VKSIKTSLLLATVLASSVAFAADGPDAKTTVQVPNNYDLSTLEKVDESSVFHAQSNRGYQRVIYSVQAMPAPKPAPLLVVEEAGTKVTRVVEGVRYDVVEKQNAFQYKYKPR
jgi:hypothetical protein